VSFCSAISAAIASIASFERHHPWGSSKFLLIEERHVGSQARSPATSFAERATKNTSVIHHA
jgi:hypothetical protein